MNRHQVRGSCYARVLAMPAVARTAQMNQIALDATARAAAEKTLQLADPDTVAAVAAAAAAPAQEGP